MVVRNRIKEVGTVLAAKDQEVETKSLNHENGVDEETLASFLSHLEKINSGVERIVQNNEKIRETQKHFFNEFSTSGRERYQDEHKNSVKVELDSTSAAMMTMISILYTGGVGVAHKNSSTERHQEISNGHMERL